MKKLVPVFFVCSSMGWTSEPLPMPRNDKGEVVFTGVVPVLNRKLSDIYANAKFFISREFNSANAVVQLDDPISGRIIAKGISEIPIGLGQVTHFKFTLTIEVKDEKYRWTIDQIQYGSIETNLFGPIERALNKDGFGKFGIKSTVESFRKSMEELAVKLSETIQSKSSKNADF